MKLFKMGVNVSSPVKQTDAAAVKSIQATEIRFGWETTWDFSQLVAAVKMCHDLGLRITLCVTPASRDYADQMFPDFCARAARLLHPDDVIEIYNEGNHKPFARNPNAAAWARCFNTARQAIMRVVPEPRPAIVLGGLSTEANELDPRRFLVDAINNGPKVDGVSAVLLADGFAMHPYCFPSDPRSADAWNPILYLDHLHDIFRYCDIEAMPFHLTEFGAPSGRTDIPVDAKDPTYPNLPYRYGPEGQMYWFANYMEALRSCRANVVSAIWFTLNDYKDSTKPLLAAWDPFCGLRNSDGTPKPVSVPFRAVAAVARRAAL